MPKGKLYDTSLALSIRVPDKEALTLIAAKKNRTASDLIRHKLEEFIEKEVREGYHIKQRYDNERKLPTRRLPFEKGVERTFFIVFWSKRMKEILQDISRNKNLSMSYIVRGVIDEVINENQEYLTIKPSKN